MIPSDLDFERERRIATAEMIENVHLRQKSLEWMIAADQYKFSYNFRWMGLPIIKYPNDMVVLQEIFWETRPDLIIEVGVARGGSLAFSAGMQEMMGIDGSVVGVDIFITEETRTAIENHHLGSRIHLIEGNSVSEGCLGKVEEYVRKSLTVIVILDSDHSHSHVLEELKRYSKFVTKGSFLILPDTFIEFFPQGYFSNRNWDVGNNPYTACEEFLANVTDFERDSYFSYKAMISETIGGVLKRV
jgi:cephalosporin hydroxylase